MSYAQKETEGKEDFSLIPVGPIAELGRVYTFGATKYDRDNWRKGRPFTDCYAAMLRHLFKWWNGETFDVESGCHHLAHVAFWCFTLIEYSVVHKQQDNRPTATMSFYERP